MNYHRLRIPRVGLALVFAMLMAGILAVEHFGIDRAGPAAAASRTDTLTASFPICGNARRVTCVVDGDKFWLDGVKIRVADIDAPELTPPRCEAERARGESAKYRLQELLNAGAFSLLSGVKDEDRYGRKLRTVTRNGRSIGDVLVSEGLARRWDGARHPWCD
jgi:endonuclease YncB( thermonuclease family)